MRRADAVLVLVLVLAGGCSKHSPPPLAPETPTSSSWIDEVSPPARATRIFDDAEVWAHSTVPLEPASVNDTSVFLKIDTQRQAAHVAWDGATQRIRVMPTAPLQLGVTYTVEITPKLLTASGATVSGGYRWQFTMFSLRRLTSPGPADRVTGESPFVTLTWRGTENSAVIYDVFAGTDSGAVASRQVARLTRTPASYFLPGRSWPLNGPTYWSVTERNQTTGESLDGPVWRFDPVPASTPVDSLVVPVSFWYWSSNYAFACGASQFRTDFAYAVEKSAAIRWDLHGFGPALRVAGARIDLGALPISQGQLSGAVTTVHTSSTDFNVCEPNSTGPFRTFAEAGSALASGGLTGPTTMSFTSDALCAHLEATVRHPELALYGYAFTSVPSLDWAPPGGTWASASRLVLYVYRPGSIARR